jgi:Mn-dependent DtxR family transcriptional regulator
MLRFIKRRLAMKNYESAEDYLEAILMISKEKAYVISKDIVEKTGYSKPSISIAMKKLRDKGLINIDNNHKITLTKEGYDIATQVLDRHETLTMFFKKLGVNSITAAEDACRMEHFLSEESYSKIKEWIK